MASKKIKNLITGGAGFIGSNLVDALVKRGEHVTVLDDLSTGNYANIAPLVRSKRIRFIRASVLNERALKRAMRGVDYVFHFAACRAVKRSVDDPLETNDVNVTGTLKILLAARDAKVKRFIFSSSSSVYGNTKKFPCEEKDKPNPQSPYAASKIMGEYYCSIFTSLYGLETVSLRYFNVFGPRQNPESIYSAVIPIFMDCILKDKPPEVHWDGKQSRDFSFVDNVVHANLLASRARGVKGMVFNIACHEENSVLDVLQGIQRILGKTGIRPNFRPKRAGDVRRTLADIRLSKKYLGFKPQTLFKEGLKETVEWFLKSKYGGTV